MECPGRPRLLDPPPEGNETFTLRTAVLPFAAQTSSADRVGEEYYRHRPQLAQVNRQQFRCHCNRRVGCGTKEKCISHVVNWGEPRRGHAGSRRDSSGPENVIPSCSTIFQFAWDHHCSNRWARGDHGIKKNRTCAVAFIGHIRCITPHPFVEFSRAGIMLLRFPQICPKST